MNKLFTILLLVLVLVGGCQPSVQPVEPIPQWHQETFQGQPCWVSPDGEWYLQCCADGDVLILHEWERWTDSTLSKIAGY